MDENQSVPYIEPIFRFCCKRLSNRHDAEDLASEVICCILEGMQKHKIDSLDAWLCKIAHNRYASICFKSTDMLLMNLSAVEF